jgi:carbamoyltransferase
MVRRNIIVLGINDGHNTGAALIRNEVLASVQERLNKFKNFAGVPEKSILEVFGSARARTSMMVNNETSRFRRCWGKY